MFYCRAFKMGRSDHPASPIWHSGSQAGCDYAAAGRSSAGNLGKLERQHLFRTDNRFLLNTVAQELRKHDALKSGLIPAAKFNDVLEDLGLRYGSPEIDLILRFCTVTEDGYVHYKHLLLDTSPYKDTHSADSVEESLRPPNVVKQDVYTAPSQQVPPRNPQNHVLTPNKSDQIRRLYCMWDKNAVRDAELLTQLRALGVPVTPEFERLMITYGPSRTLSFSQFMRALHINEYAWRKSRTPVPDPETIPGLRCSGAQALGDRKRNPITWSEAPIRLSDAPCPPSSMIMSDEVFNEEALKGDVYSLLQKLASNFLDGNQPSSHFRNRLQRLGLRITPELDALIRSHDSDNSGQFKDLMRLLLKSAFQRDAQESGGAESEAVHDCRNLDMVRYRIPPARHLGHGDIIAWRQNDELEGMGEAQQRISRRALLGQPKTSDFISWRDEGDAKDSSSKPASRGRGGRHESPDAFQGSLLLPEERSDGRGPTPYGGKRRFISVAAQCPFGTELNSGPNAPHAKESTVSSPARAFDPMDRVITT